MKANILSYKRDKKWPIFAVPVQPKSEEYEVKKKSVICCCNTAQKN